MGIAINLLCAYGVRENKYEAHKQNQNPVERRIQEINGTTCPDLDHSVTPSWYRIFYVQYIIVFLNFLLQKSLSWLSLHKYAYVFTPNVSHLTKFEFWDTILIIDTKNQFPEYCNILGYYGGPSL